MHGWQRGDPKKEFPSLAGRDLGKVGKNKMHVRLVHFNPHFCQKIRLGQMPVVPAKSDKTTGT